MTKTDFAELKEKLTKFDEDKFKTNLCDFQIAADLEIKRLSAKEQFDKSTAIISELIEIIKLQSEALELIASSYSQIGDAMSYPELAKAHLDKSELMMKEMGACNGQ